MSLPEIEKEVMKLDTLSIQLLVIKLMRDGRIPFLLLIQTYVDELRKVENELKEKIMPLALHLAMATEGQMDKEGSLKLLHETGYLTGSGFGEKLRSLFGAETEKDSKCKKHQVTYDYVNGYKICPLCKNW